MTKRVAVAVIHGIGSQGAVRPPPDRPSFSKDLFWGVQRKLGAETFTQVTWREIFWADILQSRQDEYLGDICEDGARWRFGRSFVMHNLADAASYRRNQGGHENRTYRRVHARVARTLRRLENIVGEDTPLVVLAHSMGGHVMSNFIYDTTMGQADFQPKSGFQRFETLSSFVTFGCNIPVFSFSCPRGEITPIRDPGARIVAPQGSRPWWLNLNDQDDILGMPLAPSAPAYGEMVRRGELEERWVDAAPIGLGATPLSHVHYWRTDQVQQSVADAVSRALQTPLQPAAVLDRRTQKLAAE